MLKTSTNSQLDSMVVGFGCAGALQMLGFNPLSIKFWVINTVIAVLYTITRSKYGK